MFPSTCTLESAAAAAAARHFWRPNVLMSKSCSFLSHRRLRLVFIIWVMLACFFYVIYISLRRQHIVAVQRDASLSQEQSAFNSSGPDAFPFPNKIWQTGPAVDHTRNNARLIRSWLKMNPDFRYEFLTDRSAEQYVRDHFSSQPEIMNIYFETRDVILRADILRLLLMLGSGGVYSDIDTSCTVPVEKWIPETYYNQARLVIGIELDYADEDVSDEEKKKFQLCQWTLLAAPGNKHLENVVKYVFKRIRDIATEKHVSVQELGDHITVPEVITTTGPIVFTQSLLQSISTSLGESIEETTYRITRLKAPLLLDDVLFLPINAFGGHQYHSHSRESGWGTQLVRHYWASSWWAAKEHN